jgi:hypothetical protein
VPLFSREKNLQIKQEDSVFADALAWRVMAFVLDGSFNDSMIDRIRIF